MSTEPIDPSVNVQLILPDDRMPRTAYWQQVLDACALRSQGQAAAGVGAIFLPTEDTAVETNWPRYARMETAYVRGAGHDLNVGGQTMAYLQQAATWCANNPDKTLLLVNMHPFFRVPLMVHPFENMVVADGSLSAFERCVNPRTISLPALPINVGGPFRPGLRPLFASFQGAPSHPVREQLARLHDGRAIVVNLIDPARHGQLKLDAVNGVADREYQSLLERSNFAFVPRGDALFSYRLLEVLSFGCIPIVLSDGWVLPFDRTVRWSDLGFVIHHEALEPCMQILRALPPDEILRRQAKVAETYARYFQNLGLILDTTLREAVSLL